VGSLKASLVFLADLSRAMPMLHGLDFVELAGYGSAQMGGHEQIRVLKDLDADIGDRDVIIVEDVVDTGLTLHYLVRTFELRKPRSIAAVTLLDRPYRRLVDDLPLRRLRRARRALRRVRLRPRGALAPAPRFAPAPSRRRRLVI
jgi:hypoxanthine phosphoribosyltransferase